MACVIASGGGTQNLTVDPIGAIKDILVEGDRLLIFTWMP